MTTPGVPSAPRSLGGSQAADFLLGGVDVAIDAVGSTSSLDLAMRATRAG